MVEFLVEGLFVWKRCEMPKTWSGQMARESPRDRALLMNYMAFPPGMASQRLLARIQAPETCPTAQNVVFFFQTWEETQSYQISSESSIMQRYTEYSLVIPCNYKWHWK